MPPAFTKTCACRKCQRICGATFRPQWPIGSAASIIVTNELKCSSSVDLSSASPPAEVRQCTRHLYRYCFLELRPRRSLGETTEHFIMVHGEEICHAFSWPGNVPVRSGMAILAMNLPGQYVRVTSNWDTTRGPSHESGYAVAALEVPLLHEVRMTITPSDADGLCGVLARQ